MKNLIRVPLALPILRIAARRHWQSQWHTLIVFSLLLTVAQAAPDETLTEQELALVRAAEQQRIDAIDRVYGTVVAVYGNDREGGGSGVVYDPAGFALTNHHVVAAAGKEGWAGLADGKLYRWKLIGTDPGGDIAIIRLTGKDRFPAAPIGDSDKVRVGQWAMAMGNPFVLAEDQRPTVTLGIVSGVERWQEGAGGNTLIYGNCIQVDSSINPGNSGGPLFSLGGQVIGINGRGSFKERGRVNVGLGYAVSMNQITTFIPDLLATKVAQHGTLDATFGNRIDGVLCDAINLDSAVAKAGLELGDRMISFEGKPITDANQFTNLISTLPEGWPVKFVVQRGDRELTFRVRLTALPYARPPQPMPVEEKKEEEPKDDGGEDDEKEGGEEKEEQPHRIIIPMQPELSLGEPGTIGDEELNRENCEIVLEAWRRNATSGKGFDSAVRIADDIMRGGNKVGTQQITFASDGRFHLQYVRFGITHEVGFDGKKYWQREGDGEVEHPDDAAALKDPYFRQAQMLASMLCESPLESLGTLVLDGSDKALEQPSYRVRIDADAESVYVWLSLLGKNGLPNVQLLKTGTGIVGNETEPSVAFFDWNEFEGIRIPNRRAFVEGLGEEIVLEFVNNRVEVLDQINDDDFSWK